MYCKKCGAVLLDTDKFCRNCGEAVLDTNLQNFDTNYQSQNIQSSNHNFSFEKQIDNQIHQSNNLNNQTYQNNESKDFNLQSNNQNVTQINNTDKVKKGSFFKILAIVGGSIVGIIILFIVVFSLVLSGSSRLVCTSGSCKIDGKEIEKNDDVVDNGLNSTNIKTVGDEKYGYVNVPNNWYKFHDIGGASALQYSYASVFIVSLDVLDNQYSAEEYASFYMSNKKSSSEVTGVDGATVTIGKNKQYTAYQVYMYYPSESIYLVTYWFLAEDGKVHYISLEGLREFNGTTIADYLSIPESFSLRK